MLRTPFPPGANLCVRLLRNHQDKGRDLVGGDVHEHFSALRQVLEELDVGEHDRVCRIGDLVDRSPDSL